MNETTQSKLDMIQMLAAACPASELDPAQVNLYLDRLKDLPAQLLGEAVNHFIENNETAFMPSIGQIRAYCARVVMRAAGIPMPDEAWRQVMQAVEEGRRSTRSFSHEIVREALKDVASLFTLERANSIELASHRKRFIEAFEARTRRRREALQMSARSRRWLESEERKALLGEVNLLTSGTNGKDS